MYFIKGIFLLVWDFYGTTLLTWGFSMPTLAPQLATVRASSAILDAKKVGRRVHRVGSDDAELSERF